MSEGDEVREPDESGEPLPLAAEPLPVAEIVAEERPLLAKRPHPGFWWAVLWCFGFLLITQLFPGLVGAVVIMLLIMGSSNRFDVANMRDLMNTNEYSVAMMVTMLLAQILSILMAWLVIRLIVGREWPRIVALRRPSLVHLFLAVIGLPGLILIGMGVDGLAKQVVPSIFNLEDAMAMFGKWPWPVGVLIIGVGPGIGEELWCRGFLGRGLVGRHGFLAGVILTSLLFGLIHIEPRQALAAFFMGLGLHLSYLASRSLLVPMLLHFGNNSLSVLSMHIPALKALDIPPEQIPLPVYGAGILLVAAVGWAFYQSRALLADLPAGEATFPWRPAFAGVEYPPAGSETTVRHVWPDWKSWVLVASGVMLFLGSVFLAIAAA